MTGEEESVITHFKVQGLPQMRKSSFSYPDKNTLVAASNALRAIQPCTEMVHQQFLCSAYLLWL
jgi:hypothetical protein